MAIYLVGADDKGLFKKRTTWELEPALQAAQPGDIIEIQKGFTVSLANNQSIKITKNLTIRGQAEKEANDQIVLPMILGRMVITNASQIKLENIYFRNNQAKDNCLIIKEGSTVHAENTVFENTAINGENYPIIHISDQSSFNLMSSRVEASQIHDAKHEIFCLNSKLAINHSYVDARITLNHSQFEAKQIEVMNSESHVLYAHDQSVVNVDDSIFQGGKVTESTTWSCVRIVDSILNAENMQVIQENCNQALGMRNAKGSLIGGEIDSARFENTAMTLQQTVFDESVWVDKNSQLTANQFMIVGKPNRSINLFANADAVIKADEIIFCQFSEPNIKLHRSVTFEVPTLTALEYDLKTDQLLRDEQGNYRLKEVDIRAGIEYFGDKTAFDQLNDMIGLAEVKSEVKEFIAMVQMNQKRAAQGLSAAGLTLHSLFLGNPGTGKTTVARIIGKLLYQKGLIQSDRFIETSRSDLVGQYVGHTAQKTREVLESALGGVLFIDEAYTLASEGKDFGGEAINEILKFMEDHRADIVIIFAGYTDEMDKFLAMNEGLKSRIPNVFHFTDYSEEELATIGLAELQAQSYTVDAAAYRELIQHNFALDDDKSNGRWVRNLNERLIKKLALRLVDNDGADISAITQEDLKAVKIKEE